ncbi:TPA: SAM-dependent methyltransferase [Patescibacteria group bacterium]|uniref:Methyltransferase type 11 n=1 Tax=Candidatus Gottesmanbacteria bacterium GW2011_GWA1_43_11 TaxID=1618436 RepID=A0A0G1ET73_9BACT|nr:MAG: Methyltransferase type 11 [Candidatus Gottesmanbacteria bacterium GW2011_GWA1_43_11]HCS78498.1 SAM-dependent methyltransferase [Patescibacteria group bacterium]
MNSLLQFSPVKNIFLEISQKRVDDILRKITPYLRKKDRILDIGSGFGLVSHELLRRGFTVYPLDIQDRSLFSDVYTHVYDGKKLPFPNNKFDVALLITVLHHVLQPEVLLKDVTRVAKKIILMEDVYESEFERYATYAMDSIVNAEFVGHPHSNKTDRQWREVFKKLRLKVTDCQSEKFWGLFTSMIYDLKRSSS